MSTPAARLAAAGDETLWLVSVTPGSRAHLAYENGRAIVAICNGRSMGRFALPAASVPDVATCARCAAIAGAR